MKKTIVEKLVEIVINHKDIKLIYKFSDETTWITISNHSDVRLDSYWFKLWMIHKYGLQYENVLTQAYINKAIKIIKAGAQFVIRHNS